MAMPASASDRAGESLMPSPTIRTVCPSRRSRATYSALSAGRTPAREVIHSHLGGNGGGGAVAVAGEHDGTGDPQSTEGGQNFLRLLPQRVGDADHGGQHPPMARYRWEYSGGRASKRSCSPSGMTHPSSSKIKWALPMRTSPPHRRCWRCRGPPDTPPWVAPRGAGPGAWPPPPRRWPWNGGSAPPDRRPAGAFRLPLCR